MATLNRKIRTNELTHEGAPSVAIDPLAQLERSVMSCLLWEKEFYEDGITIADRIRQLITQCRPEDVADIAIQAKVDMRLRHVPLFIARELARTKEGRKQLKNVIPALITRPDDITELLAMYFADNKKAARAPAKLPNQLKKYLGASFKRFSEYQLQKWNGGKKEVTLRDAMRMLHPKPTDEAQAQLWKRLINKELATPDTWEVELSQSTDKKASWTRLLTENKLGGLAMLRNIRNMRESGVDPVPIKNGINSIQSGKLLPINFIAAAVHNPQFEPELETKFLKCFANQEKLSGKTIILVDVSGSMDEKLSGRSELKRIDVACSLAMIGKEMFEEVAIFTFSNSLVQVPARRGFALRDAILNSQPHGGTDLGGAIKAMPKDIRLIVITDEQSHTPVEQRKGYMINVASAKNGVGYHQWVHIDGWSDKCLSYIAKYEQRYDKS